MPKAITPEVVNEDLFNKNSLKASPEYVAEFADIAADLEACFSLTYDTDLTTMDEAWEILADVVLDEVVESIPHREYANDPVGFARDILGINNLTDEQKIILRSIVDQTVTNVRAAAGVGKSFTAAIAVNFWTFAVGGRSITTAPTGAQVDEILWSEIRQMYDKNREKLGGRRGRLFLRLTEKARAVGFASKDYDSNAFQGKHAEKLLIILDEACGISRDVDDAAMACVTGSMNRLLRIGNPIADGNPFSEACARNSIAIPAWNHPNVAWAYEICVEDGIHRLKPEIADKILKPDDQRGDDPVYPQQLWPPELPRDAIPGAISIQWIEMIRSQKTEKSPFWQSRVEGFFPEDSELSIVPRSWFWSAVARYQNESDHWDEIASSHINRHGLDVGDGGDPHAWARWKGPVLYNAEEKQTQGDRMDVSRAAAWGMTKLRVYRGMMGVDRLGVGAGALSEILIELEKDSEVSQDSSAFGVNFGSQDPNAKAEDMVNLRADYYWQVREGFRKGSVAIAIDSQNTLERLADELAKSYYEETLTGKVKMEDKAKKTRARLKRSPNLADAVTMAYPNQDDEDLGGGGSGGDDFVIGLVERRVG
jgi:AAA domain